MRLINADTVLTFQTYDEQYEEWHEVRLTIEEALDKFSDEGCPNVVDVETVRHGHWTLINEDDNTYECSVCLDLWDFIEGTPKDNGVEYCPHCGAKMDERKEDG